GPLRVGDNPWVAGTRTLIEDYALYNRALSSSEIAFLADSRNEVIGANQAPVLVGPGDQISRVSEPVSLNLDASDPNGDNLTFSATGLPTGLTIDNSGQISGTPTAGGTFSVSVTASDGKAIDTEAFQWDVRSELTADTVLTQPRLFGSDFAYTINANGQNLTFVWDFGDGSPLETTTTGAATHIFETPGRFIVKVTITDDAGQTTEVSFQQAVHDTLTAQKPAASQTIIYEERENANDRVWNVNPDNDTVSVFDTVTNAKLAEIAVDAHPRSLAIADDGRIWVTNKDAATISIIDPATLQVEQTLTLSSGSQPHGIVANPAGEGIYLALEATQQLLKLRDGDGTTESSVDVGTNPRHISINADGTQVYVSRFITPPMPGEASGQPNIPADRGAEIVVVQTSDLSVSETIILQNSATPDAPDTARGIPNYVGPAAISPDGRSAWVASKQDNIERGVFRENRLLTHDSTVRGVVSRIDLEGGAEDHGSRVDFDNASVAVTSTYGPFGNFVFVALEGSRHVAIVDAFQRSEIARFETDRAPQGLVVSPDGNTLYVHNFLSRNVTVHDITNIVAGGQDDPPKTQTWAAVAAEKFAPDVLLGKQHFYDTLDTRLAVEEYISCASCHNDGGQDGRVWDLTQFGEGLRNTIDLRGRGAGHGKLHWTANFDEVHDFEGQIRDLAGGQGLLTEAQFAATQDPLGAPKAGLSPDLDALAAYVESLTEFPESPFVSNAATGQALFTSQGCATCHGGDAFSDSIDDRLHDVGTFTAASGQGKGQPLTGLDTPTLRGVWANAPYLHDGSAPTIADAIRAHTGVVLTNQEFQDIAAYVEQIDSGDDAPPPPDNTGPTLQLATASNQVSAPFTVSATFSRDVSGFEIGDISVTNGAASNFSGSADSYTFQVAGQDFGQVIVSVAADSSQDAGNRGNQASNILTVEFIDPNGGGGGGDGIGNDPAPQQLLVHLPFEEGAGTTAENAAGDGGDATLNSGVTWATGQYGGGLLNDGLTGEIEISHSEELNLAANGGDFTVSFWVQGQDAPDGEWHTLAKKGGSWEERCFALFVDPDFNEITFAASTPNSFNEGGFSGVTLDPGVWLHITCVKRGQTIEFYANGEKRAEEVLTGPVQPNTGSIYLGAAPNDSNSINAIFDEFRIHSVALTAEQIRQLPAAGDGDGGNGGGGGGPGNGDALIVLAMNEGQGATTADQSGNGQNAQLQAGSAWTAGRFDGGIVTDGVGEGLVIPHNSDIDLGANGGDFSVAFWTKIESPPTGEWRVLAKKGDDWDQRAFGIYISPDSNELSFALAT
ncbi:MAG: LamG-like jellyroll fold domain-containing protein, partial [Verrucomicrobiota bacterium]